jgi:hypothetical protein
MVTKVPTFTTASIDVLCICVTKLPLAWLHHICLLEFAPVIGMGLQ